jgi:hypothetical protein
VRFDHPAQQTVLQDYTHIVENAEARRDRLTRQIEEMLPSWSYPVIICHPLPRLIWFKRRALEGHVFGGCATLIDISCETPRSY